MEQILQTVVIVFMAFLCALCLFAVVVIVRDIISENATTRRSRERNRILEEAIFNASGVVPAAPAQPAIEAPKAEPVAPAPVVTVAPVQPEVQEETAVTEVVEEVEEPASEVDENAVSFSRKSLTMEEKYAMLSSEFKGYFDQIIKHALAKEGVKELKFGSSYDYKIGAYRVLRISIKRGEIVCEFIFIDREFRDYVNTSNIKMKQSATVIRVLETSAVGAVKDGIDRVCAQIAEDKEYKKNLAKEKRRERRRLVKENNEEA